MDKLKYSHPELFLTKEENEQWLGEEINQTKSIDEMVNKYEKEIKELEK